MYNVFFSDDALLDIQESFIWYEEQKKGLGDEFLDCIYKSTEKILNNPYLYQLQYRELRIKIVPRFPYRIFFMIQEHEIIIHAVLRMSRNTSTLKNK